MAINIGGGVAIADTLTDNADSDTYQVFLREGETYDFWMAPDPSGGITAADISDAFLTLTGPGGGLPESDNDSAEGKNATIVYTATQDGIYTLTAREFGG